MLSLFRRGCPILPDIAAGICYRTGIFGLSLSFSGFGISKRPRVPANAENKRCLIVSLFSRFSALIFAKSPQGGFYPRISDDNIIRGRGLRQH
jgi:hypothetical protein